MLTHLLNGNSGESNATLNVIPCAIVIWSPDRQLLNLNHVARQLLGLLLPGSEKTPVSWLKQIHPDDHERFLASWGKLLAGDGAVCCDYRFYPPGTNSELWLRDVSFSYLNESGKVGGIVSAYSDISDLKTWPPQHKWRRTPSIQKLIQALAHEMRNNLHVIGWETEMFLQSEHGRARFHRALEAMARVNRSVQELREFFSATKEQCSEMDIEPMFIEVCRDAEKELRAHGVSTTVECDSPLPPVRINPEQFRRGLLRLIDFSRALLDGGGELKFKAGQQEVGGKLHAKLEIVSISRKSLDVQEKDVFQPFLRVNGRQIGLGVMTVREIVRRHSGKITFQKEGSNRAVFRVLLESPVNGPNEP